MPTSDLSGLVFPSFFCCGIFRIKVPLHSRAGDTQRPTCLHLVLHVCVCTCVGATGLRQMGSMSGGTGLSSSLPAYIFFFFWKNDALSLTHTHTHNLSHALLLFLPLPSPPLSLGDQVNLRTLWKLSRGKNVSPWACEFLRLCAPSVADLQRPRLPGPHHLHPLFPLAPPFAPPRPLSLADTRHKAKKEKKEKKQKCTRGVFRFDCVANPLHKDSESVVYLRCDADTTDLGGGAVGTVWKE